MRSPRLGDPLLVYALAVLATAAAVGLRVLADPVLGKSLPFATLFGGVAVTIWFAGMGPSILAAILGYLVCEYLFVLPRGSLPIDPGELVVRFSLYAISCGFIIGFGSALRRSRQRAEEQRRAVLREREQREHLEERSQNAERRMASVIESLPDGFIQFDRDWRYVYVNQAQEKLADYRLEDVSGRTLWEAFPDLGSEIETPFRKAMEERTSLELEFQYPTWDRWFLLRGFPTGDGGFALFSRDITDRKREENERRKALEAERDRLRELETLYATSPAGLCLLDRELRYVRINDRLAEMNGRSAAEHLGRTVREMVPDLADEAEPAFRRVLETGEPVIDIELSGETPAQPGVMRTWLESWYPLRDGAGAIVGLSVIAQEITALKKRAHEIESAFEQLRVITEAMSAPVTFCDREYRYRWVSQPYAEWLGRPAESIVNRPISEVLGQEAFEHLRPHFDRVLAGELVSYEEEITFASIGPRWIKAIYTPTRDAAGQVTGWVALVLDLHERKQFEAALRHADRRKDEFLATLAHELRNPLAPIRNAVNVLKLKAPTQPELVWGRDIIDRQAEHMARLLDDLLDVSRISRNTLRLRKELTDLSLILQHAIETSRPLIDASRHELRVCLPEGPMPIEADPVRLAQVFANLLNNAAKYTDPGGVIELKAERTGEEAVVTVTDNGIGLAREQMGDLFQMFAQATPAIDRDKGGLGIGLSLVKGLVELHGGTVEARSEGPGKGSTFFVRLPSPAWSAKEAPPAIPAQAPPQRRRVLVVDDVTDNADSMALMLRLLGQDVRAVYGSQEALEVGDSFQPEVVLLDIGLPGMNGYDTCARMRRSAWGAGAVMIALTGWGQSEDRRRSQEAGFDHHLVKPADPAAILRLLESPRTETVAPAP